MSPRYLIASGCPIATTTLYRCLHLQEQLEALGYQAHVVEWFDDARINPREALRYDVLFLYRLAMSPPLRSLIDLARAARKVLIFDTDDLIFAPELIAQHRAVRNLSPHDQVVHADGVQRYLSTLLACDAATMATPLLAELAEQRGKPAFVHRNALGTQMSAVADRLRERRHHRPPGKRVVIGYGSGTPTHDVDFKEAAAALVHILHRFPQAELWIAGPLNVPSSLVRFGDRLRLFPLTNWQNWFELASQMDIALAPLEMGNIFCRAKSEIKFVEAGALEVPLVASEIDPFQNAITHGVNGFLAAGEADWTESLALLIEQPERRAEIGKQASETVWQRYSPQIRTGELAALLPLLK